MKGLKKLALATAVAAAPFAQAEMTAMDDALLGEMTGQAGVTIELSAQVSVGGFEYTDTDGLDGAEVDAGTLGINGIKFGGADAINGFEGDANDAFDDVKIDIDVDANDGLIIHLGGTNLMTAVTGANPVDFGLAINDVTLNDTLALASGIEIVGNLGPVDIEIANSGSINVEAYFEVLTGAMDIDVLGMGISNLTIGQDSNPIASGRYAAKVGAVQAGAVAANSAGAGGAIYDAKEGVVATLAVNNDADASNDVTQADIDGAADNAALTALGLDASEIGTYQATVAGATSQVQAGAIVGVSNMAYVQMTVDTVATEYFDLGTASDVAVTNALSIDIKAMSMDISADLTLGALDGTAASLGSIKIDDLDLTGTSMVIYGH